MKRKSPLLWFVLLVSMSSCVSFEKFSIEVCKPAELSLPPEFRKIVLVSRNLKYENDTLQDFHAKNHHLVKDKIKFNSDSLSIKTCLDSLSVKLAAQGRFDSIWILPVKTFPEKRVKEIRPDKSEWYAQISKQTGVDGLIVLDMFSSFYSQIDDYSSPSVNVITSNIWSVYNARTQKIIDRFTQIDTLYWDDTDENGQYKKLRIPEKREAIILASGVIGENYSKHLFPSWSMAYRDLMSCGNPDLKKAAQLAQKSKWEEATAIWQNYAENKNKRNRVISLYNMALGSEMSGDLVQAIELTDQAAKASSGAFLSILNEAVRKYSAVLYQRKTEIEKLDIQHEIR